MSDQKQAVATDLGKRTTDQNESQTESPNKRAKVDDSTPASATTDSGDVYAIPTLFKQVETDPAKPMPKDVVLQVLQNNTVVESTPLLLKLAEIYAHIDQWNTEAVRRVIENIDVDDADNLTDQLTIVKRLCAHDELQKVLRSVGVIDTLQSFATAPNIVKDEQRMCLIGQSLADLSVDTNATNNKSDTWNPQLLIGIILNDNIPLAARELFVMALAHVIGWHQQTLDACHKRVKELAKLLPISSEEYPDLAESISMILSKLAPISEATAQAIVDAKTVSKLVGHFAEHRSSDELQENCGRTLEAIVQYRSLQQAVISEDALPAYVWHLAEDHVTTELMGIVARTLATLSAHEDNHAAIADAGAKAILRKVLLADSASAAAKTPANREQLMKVMHDLSGVKEPGDGGCMRHLFEK